MYLELNWQHVLDTDVERLSKLFDTEGDAAYGVYQQALFRPIKCALETAGLKAVPGLPGDFQASREWGNPDETEQQRWMWSVIVNAAGEPLGTLVHVIHHDHTRFRVPHPPEAIALRETEKADVERILSSRSDNFAAALEFSVWYIWYLQAQREAGN